MKTNLRLLAALAAMACTPPPDEEAVDLAAAFPLAEVHAEVHRVDFGTRSARRHMGAGWSWDEKSSDGRTFVWSVGDASELRLFASEDRLVKATLRAFAYRGEATGGRVQRLDVEVNGEAVTRLTVSADGMERVCRLPLRAGANVVTFRFAWTHREGGRRLGAAFDEITFDVVEPSAARASSEDDGPRLFVPYGSEIAFYADLGGPGRLTAAGLRRRGDAAGRLEVLWRGDTTTEGRGVLDDGPVTIPAAGEPLRIALRAIGRRDAGAGWQGVVVERPRILVERPAAPEILDRVR